MLASLFAKHQKDSERLAKGTSVLLASADNKGKGKQMSLPSHL
jgi:hypothetical protein